MLQAKKRPVIGLIAGGLAAYAYYKYSRMSNEEKQILVDNIKNRGKKYLDQFLPEEIKNLLFEKKQMNTDGISAEQIITI